jgi:hypothetical protein
MKKITMLAVSVMAVFGLSGCNLAADLAGIAKVDILDLHEGYIIEGRDHRNDWDVRLEFCGTRYWYYRGGAADKDGTFNIRDGATYSNTRLNMFDSDGSSYRIDTEDVNNEGELKVGEEHEIKVNDEYIDISSIEKDTSC